MASIIWALKSPSQTSPQSSIGLPVLWCQCAQRQQRRAGRGSPLPLAILCGHSKPPRRTGLGGPYSLSALLGAEKDCSIDCEQPPRVLSEHGGRAVPAWEGGAFTCHLISTLCSAVRVTQPKQTWACDFTLQTKVLGYTKQTRLCLLD